VANAKYTAAIQLQVDNLKAVSNLEARLNKINSITERLSKKRIDLNSGGRGPMRDASGIASRKANDAIRGFLNGSLKFGKSVSSINSQLGDFNELLNMTAIKGKGVFDKQTVAVRDLATVFTQATVEARKLAEAQENLARTADPARSGTVVEAEVRNRNRRSRVRRGRERQQRFERARSSALIGGAFPLLFGQGVGASALGAAGGFAGGLQKGQMGFALSLVGTSVGAAIDGIVKDTARLGQSLNKLNPDFQQLTKSLGLVGTAEAKRIEIVRQVLGQEKALEVVRQRLANIVGQQGVQALDEFGKSVQTLSNNFSIAMTQFQTAIAKFLQNSGILDFINKSVASGNIVRAAGAIRDDNPEIKKLLNELRINTFLEQALLPNPFAKITNQVLGTNTISKITGRRTNEDIINDLKALLPGDTDLLSSGQSLELNNLNKQIELQKRSLQVGSKKALQEQEALKIFQAQSSQIEDQNKLSKQQILNNIKKRDDLKKQLVLQEQIKNLLANETTNAVMGLIEGTKTLSQSLAGVARQLASLFLNRAFMGLFGGMFGGGNSRAVQNVSTSSSSFDPFKTGLFYEYANGGYVNSPTMGLVGEAGEPEYVIPSSKMSGAMARYSAGARGGAVIPGGSGASGTVAGSSGNTIVEYTGPVLNFNGDEYVPKSAVPEIINTAAKRGGESGRAQAFSALKNSRSQRATLGL